MTMEVTRLNFIELLPEISDTIKNCDFIAIDTELSGLMRERSLNRFDLPEERFAKAIESSRGYFIMQFGLSCFTRSSDEKTNCQYDNRTYNFYIFPQDDCKIGNVNRTFSLQSHAIKFLIEHGFDFNKLFKNGLSYLTFPEKIALNKNLESEIVTRSKIELSSNGLPKFVPNGMVDDCKEWIRRAKKFVSKCKNDAGTDRPENGTEINVESELKAETTSTLPENVTTDCEMVDVILQESKNLEFKDCSTGHKRAILKRLLECQSFFENIEITSRQDPVKGETYLIINYIDKIVKKEKQRIEMLAAKGFLEVLELVIEHKKPVVGHNLVLDLIQIINQFIEPLTDDYNSFKEICHSLIPLIYDTKYIAHSILDPDTLTNNQSRLNDLYCQLRDSDSFPKIKVNHPIDTNQSNQMPHQAGYDAYMSGYCLLALCEAFVREKRRKLKGKKGDMETGVKSIVEDDLVIDNFANKIHLSYSYDFKCFNLGGTDEEPKRDHVFYIEYPENWTLDDIFQVFHQQGGVTVSKLNRTTALCALRDTKYLEDVMSKAEKLNKSNSNHKIYSYDKYLEDFKPKNNKKSGGDCDVFFDF